MAFQYKTACESQTLKEKLTFQTASELVQSELQQVHLSQEKSPTNGSPSYLSPQAKPEAVREAVGTT